MSVSESDFVRVCVRGREGGREGEREFLIEPIQLKYSRFEFKLIDDHCPYAF